VRPQFFNMENREVPKRISRRGFLIEAAVTAAGVVGAVFLGKEIMDRNQSPEVLDGKPIGGEIGEEHILITDSLPDQKPILRKDLSLSDKKPHWLLESGIPLKVRGVYGPVYPTSESYLEIEEKGRKYGVWYEVLDPIEAKNEDGTTEEVKGFLAGNFFPRKLKESELEKENQ